MSDKKDKLPKYNIMTLGNTAVGKTTFIIRYTENTFKASYLTTLGIDYKTKLITLENNKSYNINFFDTAGQEKYRSLAINVIKNAHGVILMYDVTDEKSFEAISKWMKDVIDIKGQNFPIILVGNKIDLVDKRKVSPEQGKSEADKYGIKSYEISNKFGTNIEEACLDLINQVIRQNSHKGGGVKINKKNNKNAEKKDCGC